MSTKKHTYILTTNFHTESLNEKFKRHFLQTQDLIGHEQSNGVYFINGDLVKIILWLQKFKQNIKLACDTNIVLYRVEESIDTFPLWNAVE